MSETTNTGNDLNNPNDKFFKAVFSIADIAKSFLEEFLPKDLLDKFDLKTLVIDPNSYITNELKEYFSDLVWSCRFKESNEERKVAFLLEHKSYRPAHPHFQLNDYQRSSWKMQIAAEQKPVPIIPIVFYHGKEEWIYESFDSYFGTVEPEMLRFLPCFDYILVNLQNFSDERIKQLRSVFLQKAFLSFKHYWDKNYLQLHIVELLFTGYDSIKKEQTTSFIRIMGVYLTAISGVSRKEVIEQAKKSKNNLKPEAMSIIEEFVNEGIEKGIEKGIEIAIIRLHIKGVSAENIADYMDYPLSDVKQIIVNYLLEQQKKQVK